MFRFVPISVAVVLLSLPLLVNEPGGPLDCRDGAEAGCSERVIARRVENAVTIGQFVQHFAEAKSLDAADARTAAESLEGQGITLPGDLDYDALLTEGAVTRIASAAGVRLTTSTPASPFDAWQLLPFFDIFANDLAAGNGSDGTTSGRTHAGPPFNPFAKGCSGSKGKFFCPGSKGKGGFSKAKFGFTPPGPR